MKDNRDPCVLGETLIEVAADEDSYVSDAYTRHRHLFEKCPDYVEPTVLERYGDPVAQHEAKIEAGLAVRLP